MNDETQLLAIRVLDQMLVFAETTGNERDRENYELLKGLVDRLLGYDRAVSQGELLVFGNGHLPERVTS